jgi:hypothetical protein
MLPGRLRHKWAQWVAIAACMLWSETSLCAEPNQSTTPDAVAEAQATLDHQLAWARQSQRPAPGQAGLSPNGFALRAFQLRGVAARGLEPADTGPLFAAGERADALLHVGKWSARYHDEIWLGYDGQDIAFRFSMSASLGVFLPIEPSHGPVLRANLSGELFQLRSLNLSQLTLPGAEVGYTFLKGTAQAEFVGLIGPTLLGEFKTSERWDLSGLSWGGALTFRWQALSLTADAILTEVSRDMRSIRANSRLCGLLGEHPPRPTRSSRGPDAPVWAAPSTRDYWGAICTDFSYFAVGSSAEFPSSVSGQHSVGISLLVGRISRL